MGIFFGYSDSVKGYRVHFPGLKKIEVSPSVVFDEDATFGKSKKIHADEDIAEDPAPSQVT